MKSNKQALCQLQDLDEVWDAIRAEALALDEEDPYLHAVLHSRILTHRSLGEALAQTLAIQLSDQNMSALQWQSMVLDVYTKEDSLLEAAVCDMRATLDRDPACTLMMEPFLFFKGFQAIQAHRVAHHLWNNGRTLLARIVQSAASRVFGVDIHPAARLGKGILVDHATGLVIGETAVVGNDVSILHGVTLGGTGKDTGDRHPKVEDGVLLSAHSSLLGNIRIGKGSKVGAGAVVLRDVPPHVTVAGVPAKIVGQNNCDAAALEMKADFEEN